MPEVQSHSNFSYRFPAQCFKSRFPTEETAIEIPLSICLYWEVPFNTNITHRPDTIAKKITRVFSADQSSKIIPKSGVITSTSAEEKDLSSDTQIRVLGLMAPEICTKMLKELSKKLGAKFPATSRGYSFVKIARFDVAFLDVFSLQASPLEGQSLQQKEKKRGKREGEK